MHDFKITISYIDEDLRYDERQVSPADYEFRCECIKCVDESSGDLVIAKRHPNNFWTCIHFGLVFVS